MTSHSNAAIAPIALQPGEGDARWFLGSLITIKSTADATGGGPSVTENYSPGAAARHCTCITTRTSGST